MASASIDTDRWAVQVITQGTGFIARRLYKRRPRLVIDLGKGYP